MNSGEYSLRWNKFDDNLVSNVCAFYERRIFTDVTLACDGKHFKAHKLVLAACSPYFEKLFKDHPTDHPIIYLNDVTVDYMENIMEFIYKGTTHLAAFKVRPFLELADNLKLKGLCDCPVSEEQLPAERPAKPDEHDNGGPGPSRLPLAAALPYAGASAASAAPYLSELEDELHLPESSGVIDRSSAEPNGGELSPLALDPDGAAIDLKRRPRRNAIDCVEALMGLDNNSSSDDGFLPSGSPSVSLLQSRHRILKPLKRQRTGVPGATERPPDSEYERTLSDFGAGSPPTLLARFPHTFHRPSSEYDFGDGASERPGDGPPGGPARPPYPADLRIPPNDPQRMPGHMEIPAVAPGEKWFQGRLQFMLSQRGKPLLVHDGHSFGIQYIRKDKKYWQCNLSRKYNCKARVTTTDTGDIIVTNNEHCHTEIRQHLRKDYKTMKLAASLAASRASFAVSLALPTQSTAAMECSSTTSATNATVTTNDPITTVSRLGDTDPEIRGQNLTRNDQVQRLNS